MDLISFICLNFYKNTAFFDQKFQEFTLKYPSKKEIVVFLDDYLSKLHFFKS